MNVITCYCGSDVVVLIAARFLSERSWKGLEQRVGDTSVRLAVKGRKGIAIAYEDEPQT